MVSTVLILPDAKVMLDGRWVRSEKMPQAAVS